MYRGGVLSVTKPQLFLVYIEEIPGKRSSSRLVTEYTSVLIFGKLA